MAANRATGASERARAVAACPACRGELAWDPASVRCTGCGETYRRLATGAPILLQDTAPALDETWYPGALRLLPARARRFAADHRQQLCPDLTYRSPDRRCLVAGFVASLPADAVIVDVGSGKRRYGPNVVNVDVEPHPEVDLVGVAERLPLADACCDGAILQAVLEHVRDARQTLLELHRVIRPGGALFVEVPFMQGYHPGPGDFRRYTVQGLRAELEDHAFDVDDSGVAVGPASAMAWIGSEFLAFLVSGRSEKVYRVARPIARWLVQPLKFADRWLDVHPMAYTIPSGVWARATRPA